MPLKRPVTLPQARRWPAAAKRRESFCARMGGMRELLTGERAARDPASPINRALAAWDCDEPELLKREHVSKGIRMKVTSSKVGSEAKPARKNPAKKRTAAQRIDAAPMSSRLDGYGPRKGLEGPFLMRNGRVVYYDPKEGSYYDPTTDIYLSAEESIALMGRNPARKTPAPAKVKTWAVFKVGMKTPVAVFASRADAVKFGQSWADIHKSPVQVVAA